MRLALLFAAGVVVAGIAFAQNSESSSSHSLLELLAGESLIAYRIDRDTDAYEIQTIPADVADRSREYYANRIANVARFKELEQQRASLLAELEKVGKQLEEVSRPTGFFRAGEITRRGRDFIGIRELDSEMEHLVPLGRILHAVSLPAGHDNNVSKSGP